MNRLLALFALSLLACVSSDIDRSKLPSGAGWECNDSDCWRPTGMCVEAGLCHRESVAGCFTYEDVGGRRGSYNCQPTGACEGARQSVIRRGYVVSRCADVN